MKKKDVELIEELRRSYKNMPQPDLAAPTSPVEKFDFHEHPGFVEARVMSAASRSLGIASPFFRTASAVDGARIRIDDAWLDNFCSYDYLGLNQDPRIADRVAEAASRWGVSATASRVVGGARSYHEDFESELATFLGTEAALTFVSGHATNVAAIRTLVDRKDVVFVDSLAHNSIYEGIVASGAAHFTFSHNDPDQLAHLMETKRFDYRHALVACEGFDHCRMLLALNVLWLH